MTMSMREFEDFSEITHSSTKNGVLVEVGHSEHYQTKVSINIETDDIKDTIREMEFAIRLLRNTFLMFDGIQK
ncbi:MAG: hypothetical protein V3W19_11430 [Desulfatiglandales bacterium]